MREQQSLTPEARQLLDEIQKQGLNLREAKELILRRTKVSFQAGELFALEEGEYSCYGIEGFFVARYDIDDLKKLVRTFLEAHPKDGYDSDITRKFASWLVVNEWCWPADVRKVHARDVGLEE